MSKMYTAKHILVFEEEDMEYILDKFEQGVLFEDLARDFSECESGQSGGLLGKFQSGSTDPAFEKALYHMKPGELKSGIKTKYGFHIILRVK